MLRVLHHLVLRAHPPYFRQRFAEEMQSIFDQTGGTLAAAGLLVDAILSLGRQWTLRPEFWEEPALAAVGTRRSGLPKMQRAPKRDDCPGKFVSLV